MGQFTPEQQREILHHMRVPFLSFVALLTFLAAIVALGALMPSHTVSLIEIGLTVCMVLTVLLFSMEVIEEAPLMRLFAGVGFVWVAVLFGMTMIDYLTR